jgi:hypothetical protein
MINPSLGEYTSIYLPVETEEGHENISQGSRPPRRDLTWDVLKTKPAAGPTEPPIHWVSAVTSSGGRRLGRE